MGLRSPLKGLESGWRTPMSWYEIAIIALVLLGIVYLYLELKK
jgi:hypothetical protein